VFFLQTVIQTKHDRVSCAIPQVHNTGALNLQDGKMTDKFAGVENAGVEIDGQECSR